MGSSRVEWGPAYGSGPHTALEGWLGSRLGLPVGCWRPQSLTLEPDPRSHGVWRLVTAAVPLRIVLAMQKVEGSSPFIRFTAPRKRGFLLPDRDTESRSATGTATGSSAARQAAAIPTTATQARTSRRH